MIELPREPDQAEPSRPDDVEHVAVDGDDDAAEWIELDISQPRLGDRQFGLLGLFALVTVCGAYFAIERSHQGQFGLHFVLGTLLFAGIAVPVLLLVFWIVRVVFDGALSLPAILVLVLTTAALALVWWR